MNFILVGAAGYVAPKHFLAIKEIGGELVAISDPSDSVGILDRFFPEAHYYPNTPKLLSAIWDSGLSIDYAVICAPNYLHYPYCRWMMQQLRANIICEKPLVLYERDLDKLLLVEQETGKKVNTIMQLRLGDNAAALKKMVNSGTITAETPISVIYQTPRGYWYDNSWKNDVGKSGGLATNIGIHLFDLLCWLFGTYHLVAFSEVTHRCVSGKLQFPGGIAVSFLLSNEINCSVVRQISVGDQIFDLSPKFENLHTKSYEKILSGSGFGIEDTRLSIRLCEEIRNWKRTKPQ